MMENKKISQKQLGVTIGLSALTLISSCFGFFGVFNQKTNDKNYKSWMSTVPDATNLRDLAMPGSHDTMALYSIGGLAGQCQSLSLESQLNLGIRFLDIRLKKEGNNLKAVHGVVDEKATFKDVTRALENFIKDNPREMLIMSIKEETGQDPNFDSLVKSHLTSDIYNLGSELPATLGDARGKIFILSRYPNPTIGIPAFNGWQDSTSFTLPNDIYVQDEYKVTSKEQKMTAITNCFNEAGHALKINFLSAYRSNYVIPSYAPSAALDINPWINKEIANYHDRGIVLYDYVTKENMDSFFKGVL